MKLHWIDLTIIAVYLVSVSVMGLLLQRRGSKNLKSYLLGGNELPWYFLGLSNASGQFDISGTIWLVTIMFIYGLKSAWLPWLWPTFNQIFLMVFLSTWLRRSNVTTGAQWVSTRFGRGLDAELSHIIVVIFAIIGCLGFMVYGFVGLGKFMQVFIPWESVQAYVPFHEHIAPRFVPHIYGIVFTLAAIIYTVFGGMTSIVLADVLQYAIMTVSAILVAGIAMQHLAGHQLVIPEGWQNPFFRWKLNLDWSNIIVEANRKIASDQFSWFSIIMMLMLFKGVMASAAGPAPNYDMQKILATRNPREAAMMSGFVSVVLMPVRYLMVAGFAVLGLLHYHQLDLKIAGQVDFEQVLPAAISAFVPVGLMGCILAGLLAAFLGTFAGTLNAAQAYIMNDFYIKYLRPRAGNREIGLMNYATGFIIVVVSIVLGMFAQNVNSLLQWIVAGLYGSYVASNVLKWYWWRFNGQGYFWGMLTGLIPALIMPKLAFFFPGLADHYPRLRSFAEGLPLYYFPLLFVISLIGCIIGTLSAPPTDEKTLIAFYRNVRPWGFWKPVHNKVIAMDPSFQANHNFGRDMFNVMIGTIWQTCLVFLPMYVVLMNWKAAGIVLVVVAVTTMILKVNWYDRLDAGDSQSSQPSTTDLVAQS